MGIKLQGTPLTIKKGRFTFKAQYGCKGVLYFWMVDPVWYEGSKWPDFEAVQKEVIDEAHARGEKHVYYRPFPPSK